MKNKNLVLWDGACGFCRRSVAWFEQRDAKDEFEFVPYQQAPSPPMTEELRRACAKAVHVITTEGDCLRAGRAVLFMLERGGWGRAARVLAMPPFIYAVELGYKVVAANRDFFARFMFTQHS